MLVRTSRWVRSSLCAGLAFACALPAPGDAAQSAFDSLVDRLRTVHAYEFDVDATEHAGTVTKAATMHVAVNIDDHSEQLVIIAGPHHGSVVSWSGGPEESVKLPGMMSVIPVHGPLRDSKFLSLRGNDIRVAELQTIIDCYSAHRDSMLETPGPVVDGDPTVTISISSKDGIMCDGNDWQQERAVTRDEVLGLEDDVAAAAARSLRRHDARRGMGSTRRGHARWSRTPARTRHHTSLGPIASR